jgi:flagellar basal-body rod protein FlgB
MSTFSSLQTLQGYLQAVTDRQQQITSNIANVDTPGYHGKDIDFQSEMREILDGNNSMRLQPATQDETGLTERPDGNNVDIDHEGLILAQTQLQYQLGVQLVKSQFHTLLTAIKEE